MASAVATLRIIGGRYKGKKLLLPSKSVTRSSKAILRESLFDTLQQQVSGTTFIELFGGSGSVGLEALSRGADAAYFVEKDPASYKILVQNCRAVDAQRAQPILGDTFKQTPRLLERLKTLHVPVIAYVDPPFSLRDGHETIYTDITRLIAAMEPTTVVRVVIEHMSSIDFPETIGNYRLAKAKRFGKSSLSYYWPTDALQE